MLFCFGINPSVAEPNNLDPTLKRVKKFANSNGYSSWIMLNVYPQRATNPEELHMSVNNELHKNNLEKIKYILNKYTDNSDILFAYGNLITKRNYLSECLSSIEKGMFEIGYRGKKLCLGKTLKNYPKHPLYIESNTKLIDL